MASPMSDYSYSQDASDFLDEYKKKIRSDKKLAQHQDLIQDFGESYNRAYQLWNTYYAEAYKDLSYYLGNQWSLEELAYLNNQRRSAFTYNKIRRLINLVQGHQRKNRLSIMVQPIEDASSQTADLFTDTIQHIMNQERGYEIISDAFKGSLTTGMTFLSPYVDYRHDPANGDIRIHKDEWNAVILDPFFTKRSLEDCSFIARRKYLSRTDIISLHPTKGDIIESLPWGERDDKFTYMPYARQWGMQKLMNYTEYWRTKWTVKNVLVDMKSGETKEWNGDRSRLELFRRYFPNMEVIKKPVRSVELGVIVEGELISYEENPGGLNDYPFVPFLSIFEPSYDLYEWKIQSLVRILRDPQTEINKRRSKMIDLMDSQLNSGWVAKTGAVTNNASLFKSGMGQVIFLKPEATMEDIKRIDAPQIPPSMFQLEAEFEKDMLEILGVSPENLGMAENDKIETAGVLAKIRAQAGLVNLQDLYDGLTESQKYLGEKILKLIQINYSPEKIALITKKKPTPEFFNQNFARYNVVVEEGLLTDTQRQTNLVQLLALKQLGINVPEALIIKNSNLHDKNDLAQTLQEQAKKAEAIQQQATQLELAKMQVEANAINSKAESDKSLAAERLNKIGLDAALSAERIARSEEDRTGSVLNLIRAVKELDGIDLDNLTKQINLLKSLQSGEEKEAKEQAPEASKSITI